MRKILRLHIPVILAASVMYCVEFMADKIPGVDTGWELGVRGERGRGGALGPAGGSRGPVAHPGTTGRTGPADAARSQGSAAGETWCLHGGNQQAIVEDIRTFRGDDPVHAQEL